MLTNVKMGGGRRNLPFCINFAPAFAQRPLKIGLFTLLTYVFLSAEI